MIVVRRSHFGGIGGLRLLGQVLRTLVILLFACVMLGLFPATGWAVDPEGCLICHGDPNFVRPNPDPGEGASLYVNPSDFAQSVHAGQECTSCHRGFLLTIPKHQQNLEEDWRQVVIEACEECHQAEYMEYQTSSHARFYYQDTAGPICISCHGSHQIRRVRVGEESADFKMSMARNSCGKCHQDKFETARHEFHFKALSLGYARAATCFDCHGWHQNLALHSGEEETVEVCRKCHPGANKGFTFFQMHLEESFRDAWWGVRMIYLFFSGLLIVVLVIGIAYTTIHLQKELRLILGRVGRGLGRIFGFIRSLEEESVRSNGKGESAGGEADHTEPSGEDEEVD